MPTSVTASNGNVYHLWQLPELSAPEPEDIVRYTTLDNDLSDGYRANVLFGSNTGVREWKLKFPTLAHLDVLSNTVTGPNGESVSREQYVRNLYAENKVTGTPFAYQDVNSGQYYLVDFADEELTLARMRVKIFSSGLTLRQRRLEGVTVFNVSEMSSAAFGYDWYKETGHGAVWTATSSANTMVPTGDVVFSANPQNGLNTVRFSGAASTGRINDANGWSAPIFEMFIVMKMREATFSNNAGIFTGSSDSGILVGTSGQTKFQNLLGASDEYYLNGVRYANADMQAPMNEFGIVQIRHRTGGGWDPGATIQFGKDQATAGTFAKMDVAEIISFAQRVPTHETRELIEHLTVKWAIT